jgi:hypothetical protein
MNHTITLTKSNTSQIPAADPNPTEAVVDDTVQFQGAIRVVFTNGSPFASSAEITDSIARTCVNEGQFHFECHFDTTGPWKGGDLNVGHKP